MFRFAFAFLIAFALPVAAQQGILGNVTDASGAAVPAANIRILNTDTNAASLATTNSEGFFTAPSLPVGSYAVTAEKTGFKKAVRNGITLQVDQRAQIDFRGQAEHLPEVSGPRSAADNHQFRTDLAAVGADCADAAGLDVEAGHFNTGEHSHAVLRGLCRESLDSFFR